MGVFFEFADYKRYIERSGEYRNVPSPILPSLKWLAISLACLGLYIGCLPYFDIEVVFGTEEYWSYSFGYRIFYYYVAMSLKRFYYYNPFCMTTGAIVASGFGYNGEVKGEHTWDKIIGVYIWEVETSASAIDMFRYWNT